MQRALAVTLLVAVFPVACGRPSEKAPGEAWRGARIESEADFERFVGDVVRTVGDPASRGALTERLEQVRASAGVRWPEALLAVAREVHGGESVLTVVPSLGGDRADPFAAHLLERPEGVLDDELAALATDRDAAFALRFLAIVALARPESASRADALVSVARDALTDPALREAALLRLPRLDCALPGSLDELLYLPFHGLDERAAAVLAIRDRPVATSLVLDAARRVAASEAAPAGRADLVLVVAEAVARLAPDDPEAQRAYEEIAAAPSHSSQEARRAIAGALERRITAHPGWRESAFERDRAQAREAARRAVASAPGSVADVAGLPDDRIDLPIAALSLAGSLHPETVEDLERLLILLRRDVARIPAGRPETRDLVLGLLRARLHGPRRRLNGIGIDGYATDLAEVLHLQHGNCLGLTLLWTAVGERLDLPLRPVGMPGHTAVVWSDERGEVILETTANAQVRPPEHYRSFEPLAETASDPLRPIPETALLAGLLSNLSVESRQSVVSGRAADPQAAGRRSFELARDALVLAADDVNARVNLALAAAALGDGERRDALAALDETAARADLTHLDRLLVARAYLECGRRADAKRLLRPVARRFGDDPRVRTLRSLLRE